MKKKKKIISVKYNEIELNIMPFIDVFSMLNTFLLFTAVFIGLGMTEVQIPFLSNAAPPTKPSRDLEVNVDLQKDKVELTTRYSAAPVDEKKYTYGVDTQGLTQLHQALVQLRRDNVQTDKLTLYCEDDVIYGKISDVLDAVKLRRDGDPEFDVKSEDLLEQAQAKLFVYPKVVMGSVML